MRKIRSIEARQGPETGSGGLAQRSFLQKIAMNAGYHAPPLAVAWMGLFGLSIFPRESCC